MNRFVFTLLLGLSFVCTIRAQRTMSLLTREETKGIEKTIPMRDIKQTSEGITVTYYFNNIVLLEDPLYAGATTIKIDGFWANTSVGEPSVLSRWDTFVVPETGARVVVSDSSYVEIPMELSPARPILSNSGNDTYTKNNVLPISGYRGLYPSSPVPSTRNNSYRGQRLLDVCITPLQYDYANKKVRVFTKIQYNIQYNVNALKKSLSRYEKDRISGNSFIDNITLNSHVYEKTQFSKPSTYSIGYIHSKYLIVTVPKYAAAVNRFAEWKRTLGFDVQIEMRESWTSTMVHNAVRIANQADSIDYLLIVGGHNDVPSLLYYEYINDENITINTDLYYGCLHGNFFPDFYRGRLLVSSSDEAMTVVEKIINYEKNPVTNDSFYKTGVHCAFFQDGYIHNGDTILPDNFEDRRFVLTSERIRNGMLGIIDNVKRVYRASSSVYPTYWNTPEFANGEEIPAELQKPAFAWDGDSTQIKNCINQKAFYVLMRDHGEVNKWSVPAYTIDNINQLNNGKYLPVVFSVCCLTGKFDEANCFCESFLKQKNGGCVAIIGATQKSLSGLNDVLAEGMFDAIWPILNLRPKFGNLDSTYYGATPTPTYRLGQILDQGLRRTYEVYSHITGGISDVRYTYEIFHCFGDPSMMIYTEKPTPFSNASITRGSDGFIYVDAGGPLATITFYNRRTGAITSYRGYSIAYPGDEETSVCISGHNKIPFLDEGTLYIQNQTLADGGYYEANTIKVGNNVTVNRPQGDVNFSHGSYQLVGKRVELQPGTTISHGTTMEIKIKQ